MKRYAAIDVGTNTVLMVIGETNNDKLNIIRDEHSIARLGQGVDSDGNICDDAIGRAVTILDKYANICRELKVDKIKIYGTSALRDANNRDKVIGAFNEVIDAVIEIISGEKEARLSYLGTIDDNPDSDNLVIDIGGGSTEFINGKGPEFKHRKSLQMGAVRITERLLKNSPPVQTEIEEAKSFIRTELSKIDRNEFKYDTFYAVAGTPTTVAAITLGLKDFERERIHGYNLSLEQVEHVFNMLSKLTIEEIISKHYIHPKRADVILAGILILKESLDYLGAENCIVSVQGLRYGILRDMI